MNPDPESLDIEVKLLLEAIYLKYGHDFREYSFSHMKRRILHKAFLLGISSISELQHRVLYDKDMLDELLPEFSINVTDMFRDPCFFKALRTEVIPLLETYPFIKIWHAGCSTGEEVYSMAILLKEEGLYDRCQIYATDFNELVLQQAKEGIFPVERIPDYTKNYQQAGGKALFRDYYVAQYEAACFNPSLRERITFAQHNLVTDSVFGEMNLILCRNVLIYFNRNLQRRVITLFYESLSNQSFLCLGSKESLRYSDHHQAFSPVVEKEKIYQKMVWKQGSGAGCNPIVI